MIDRAVFDTDVLIAYSKDIGAAVRAVVSCRERYISFVTWIEFLVGIDIAHRDYFKAFLRNNFTIVPCDFNMGDYAIDIRRSLRLKLPDAMIYATAKHMKCPLVTFNTKDFIEHNDDIIVPR